MNELISIIVPIYNVEQYVDECIKSIINQTYRKLQIILVDDGSTDDSGKICDKYDMEDNRITVIHKENGGLVSARKSGLKIATGRYVGFVDGDDFIEPNMYENMLGELIATQSDIVHTGFVEGEYKNIRYEYEVVDLNMERNFFLKRALLMEGIAPSIWSKLFKTDLIKEAYSDVDNRSSLGEDLICFCAAIFKAKKILLMNKAFYHYRIRKDSISHMTGLDEVKKHINLYNNLCKVVEKYDKSYVSNDLMNQYIVRFLLPEIEMSNDYEFRVQRYYFPLPEKVQNKDIVVYGAGRVGCDYYSQFCRYTNCKVVAWVDTYNYKYNYKYVQVSGLDVLEKIKYDLVVVAVSSEIDFHNIKESIINFCNTPNDKIIWEKPGLFWNESN